MSNKIGDFFIYFLILWVVIIIANQVVFFHSCMKLYCLKAALPHTSVIAAIISGIIVSTKKYDEKKDE